MIEHTERMRVNWVDTDASGLIHYTAAMRYFEVAEHALMRRLEPQGISFRKICVLPRVHVEVDYKAALRYPEEFECTARVVAVGNSSVTYGYEIRRGQTLCVTGKIVAVACDLSGQRIEVPRQVRAALVRAIGAGEKPA